MMTTLYSKGLRLNSKKIKTGVHKGEGPPPGYQWTVYLLSQVKSESDKILTSVQYEHLVLQVKELAMQKSPSTSQTVDVKRIEEFYEIRDSGGVLGSLNIRVFFGIDKENQAIVILGVIKKKNNGKTPLGDKIRMKRRWKRYQIEIQKS